MSERILNIGARIVRRLVLTLQMALLSPILILIRVARPLYLVRLGPLHSERIGHFCGNTEIYLCEKKAGMHGGERPLDLFYFNDPICNEQLKKMWRRVLKTNWIARPLDRLNRFLPGGKRHIIPMGTDRDVHGLIMKTPPHLKFTAEEEALGEKGLREIGIGKDEPFVGFSARDSAYLQSAFKGISWGYHDYRDCAVQNYLPAADALAGRGYFALRMGAVVKEPLDSGNPRIIDYASSARTDFLDVYISAKCAFFICSTEGLYAVPAIFRRPAVHVNIVPIGDAPTFLTRDIFIPKKIWLRAEKRYLTFKEMMQSGVSRFRYGSQFAEHGLDVHENSGEEIKDVVLEMDDRLKGKWVSRPGDDELQSAFWKIFAEGGPKQGMGLRIGADFLRKNQELLN